MPIYSQDSRTISYELFSQFEELCCFSTQRNGGVSDGSYSSLNCGKFSGDRDELIRENIDLALESAGLRPGHIVLPHQTHQDRILPIDRHFLSLSPEEQAASLEGVDALVTRERNVMIGVSTADCIPVLLYDPVSHGIAAIHAGWRGTVMRIAAKAVRTMQESWGINPGDLRAVIGPGISQESFEVGWEVHEAFLGAGFPMDAITLIDKTAEKPHLDLFKANSIQLEETGIKAANIQVSGICTFKNHTSFFSARRLGIQSGRILSAICLR